MEIKDLIVEKKYIVAASVFLLIVAVGLSDSRPSTRRRADKVYYEFFYTRYVEGILQDKKNVDFDPINRSMAGDGYKTWEILEISLKAKNNAYAYVKKEAPYVFAANKPRKGFAFLNKIKQLFKSDNRD